MSPFVPPEHDARRIPSSAACAAGTLSSVTLSMSIENEKISTPAAAVLETTSDVGAEAPNVNTLHRSLKSRHVQMIAIGGVIGTGLFIGTATNLQNAGPAGLLISYCLMATLLYSVMVALGEMISAFPIPGAQLALASRFLAPEVGFAIGWLYWYCYIVLLPAEISAAAVLITYWTPTDGTCAPGLCNSAVWVTVMLVVVILANIVGSTRVFGEIEFWAASIKVLTIIGLIIISIVITSGGGPNHQPIGFKYWVETGGFVQYKGIPGAWGRFLGFFAVLISAAFAFIGTEITAVAAAEAGSPAKTVPRAIKSVWLRLALFYISSAFLIGLLVSPSHPDLNLGSTAAKSPFVIAIKGAGIKVLPAIINAALLSSAWSAAIADLYISSRTLYGLYARGATPRQAHWLGKTRKDGVPWVCVTVCAAFTPLAYFAASPSASAGQAFGYFASMCAVCGMLSWSVILLTSLRWHRGLKARGIDRSTLPYRAPLQPYLSYYGLGVSIIVIVFSGFTAFIHKFDTSAFITTYFGIPFFAVLLLGYKFWHKSGLVRYEDMDFTTGFSGTDDMDGDERKGWLARIGV
ncbi:hypothetical protein CcaverHIS002_0700690 [Cutaneotrichosporon cavernicola]|uniref:Amino acid permease/ SLC12A domain-containing protein n=1 Tax=Cutaneotrichosporon cavernicola TaxID=279322 RepID=A0AA48L9U3_9TREE|nr:uncharacterized protein CcaverHIS019_0700700 [Cutaneotrichosporon cavernicola]BEI86723.1 hypothetical protein CcaverHIS002_0700690 [Cutaneotrichosporon cavernicola]BEI94498.1 hypothetical protein CcaverHIS019_0700700 [Cutaneotrichosporon cavernicola]BEJ02274.1 hypothetical protein CcaverHIS631_0700690 [Cutaneotrichosporon cavernicola]BEJ10033.1 hypothetical protein CcaverHIS641_0700680 [Cutaneotrichosporon cavernicola]